MPWMLLYLLTNSQRKEKIQQGSEKVQTNTVIIPAKSFYKTNIFRHEKKREASYWRQRGKCHFMLKCVEHLKQKETLQMLH